MSSTERAQFITRDLCIGCGSPNLRELSSDLFDSPPLHEFLSNDPWGECPVPFLQGLKWVYVQCEACHLTFHQRILSPEWSARKFDKWITSEAIATFMQSVNTPQTRFDRAAHFAKHIAQLEFLTRKLRTKKPLRLLDFGCGDGEFIEMCALFGFEAVGIDVSAARRGNNRAPVFESVSEIEGQVHVITLFEVLEHLENPKAILESLAPLLVPHGFLVLETPDTTGVESIKSLTDYQAIHPLDHINGFTPRTLREFAERLGFKAIPKPISHFTCEPNRVIKQEIKRVLKFAVPERTQQYFVYTGN